MNPNSNESPVFRAAQFIKSPRPHRHEYLTNDPATQFRKVFESGEFRRATLHGAGLGIGYIYVNGVAVSDAVLAPSQSDYKKTVWYRSYDVTALVQKGRNILAAIVGNGFFNESIDEPFSPHLQSWRDNPTLILELVLETATGEQRVVSDRSWRCFDGGPVTFNQIRNGEYFDARKVDPLWNRLEGSEENWKEVAVSEKTFGVFRRMECAPVRELETLAPVKISRNSDSYVFHFSRNISGYAKVCVRQKPGSVLTFKYGETLTENRVDPSHLLAWSYKNSVFATDQLICGEGITRWAPQFAYHGFQYIEVFGLECPPTPETVQAVFISQDLRQTTSFKSSHALLNFIFDGGIASSRNNFHNVPTDCPTREKAGWTNDGRASTRQFLLNFESRQFLEKWYRDILDTQREDGAVACIAPCTESYGFGWTAGPVSDGVLFEIPYQIWKVHGDESLMKSALPHMKKYLSYLKQKKGQDGLIAFGLWDWAGPFESYRRPEDCPTPQAFSDTLLYLFFLKMVLEFTQDQTLRTELDETKEKFDEAFIHPNGQCRVDSQTALSMLICFGYPPRVLGEQLEAHIRSKRHRLHVGMLGLYYLFDALSLSGKSQLAFEVLTAKGYPSFSMWQEQGATTLWETWQCTASKNHHMFSCVLVWMLEHLGGMVFDKDALTLKPEFLSGLDWVECERMGYSVKWRREGSGTRLFIEVPFGRLARLDIGNSPSGYQTLQPGSYEFYFESKSATSAAAAGIP